MLHHRYRVRRPLLAALLLFLLGWQATRLADPAVLGASDFVQYWAAARLHLHGGNPYDGEQLYPLEEPYGLFHDQPLMMYNPPWVLPLLWPFGLLPFGPARVLWLLGSVVVLLVCADVLWRQAGGSPRLRLLAWGVALTFYPTLSVLRMGQIGPLLLAGLTGFLVAVRSRRDVLAGAALSLCTVKPHLFVPFGTAVLVWAVWRRRWGVLLGGLALLLPLMLAVVVSPPVLGQYADLVAAGPPDWRSPTPGTYLREAFGQERTWLQWLPALLAAAWAAWYAAARPEPAWGGHLLFVSVVFAVYGAWAFDLVILLPPVLFAAAAVARAGRPRLALTAAAAHVGLSGAALVLVALGVKAEWLFWFAPGVWLACWAVLPAGVRLGNGSSR